MAHIIAEAGTNHNGSYELAQKLIDSAVQAGSDSVKFQIIYPEELYLPKFFKNNAYEKNDVFERRKQAMLPDAAYSDLAAYARTKNISLSASVFGRKSLKILMAMNPDYIKIASCDLNNSRLLREAASYGKKIIVSTGMSSLDEIEQAVKDIKSEGNDKIILMHCVSVYPCLLRDSNIKFIIKLQKEFNLPVGFSDHTENSFASAMAVSLGAAWIEKHFTLDRSMDGFDHIYAMNPNMLKSFICDIRECEKACVQERCFTEKELEVKQRARRSLYAAREMQLGDVIREEDVLIVRPTAELNPVDIKKVLGKKLKSKINMYESFSSSNIVNVE